MSVIGYATLIVSFLIQVAIARLLGAENFGVYSVTLAIVAIIEAPLVVRGSEVALRRLGEYLHSGDISGMCSLARTMLRYDIALFFSVFLMMLISALLISKLFEIDPLLFVILSLTIPAQAGFGVFKSYFTIYGKVIEMVRYELTYTIILALLNLAGIYLMGIYGLAISMAIGSFLKTLLAYFFTRKFAPAASPSIYSKQPLVSLTKDGGLSIIRNLFSNGISQIDIILLGLLQTPEIVGLYKVGKSLAAIPIKISFPVWRYLQPRLLEALQQGDHAREKRLIISGSSLLALLLLLLATPIYYFGEAVVVFFYGESYRASFEFFLILIVGIWFFHGIAGWFKFWVVITNSQWFGIVVYALAFFAALILGSIFGSVSPYAMAYVILFVMIAMSGAAYWKVFRV